MAVYAPIDLDRGVSIRIIPLKTSAAARSGAAVAMYKDDPGIYYALNGVPLDPEWAKEAGFDVEEDLKERKRRERRQAALEAVDKEFDVVAEGEVVEEGEDFSIVHMGRGWFDVLDKDGARMNEQRLRREAASEYVVALRKGKEHLAGTQTEGRW